VDASEARNHLEMVERIIAESSQRLKAGGEFFLVWGVIGAALDALIAAAVADQISATVFYVAYPLLILIGVAFSILRSRYYHRCGERMSLLQREYLNVLWLTIALATIAMFTMFNLFHSFTAEMALWSFAETLVLFYVGMHGNRRAQIGGIVLLASLILANFIPAYVGWILAAGVLLGYAGFGAAELIARD
jgi:MFS family permease